MSDRQKHKQEVQTFLQKQFPIQDWMFFLPQAWRPMWWYYPPELRRQFLEIAGNSYDDEFRNRMQVRMALHCLIIILPIEESFDAFNPERFGEALVDFKAFLDGKENPQGYDA